MIFLYGQYFLYKPLFPSFQLSKTFKIELKIYLGNYLQLIPTTGDPFQTRFTSQNGQHRPKTAKSRSVVPL